MELHMHFSKPKILSGIAKIPMLWVWSICFACWMVFTALELSASSALSGRGFKEYSPEQLKDIEDNSPWISQIKHSKVGAARIKDHAAKTGKPVPKIKAVKHHHEEISTTKGFDANATGQIAQSLIGTTLPSSVDNSQLPSFPPIGDQGQIGSCVAWGSTYYQASHEIGLLNGTNNKTSQAGVLSPKWTYNLLNGGQDGGLWPTDAFNMLAANGAISIMNFPYDTNYLAWDTNSQDWIAAISNRLAPAQMVSGLGGSQTQDLTAIKQLLTNGHVLTFATYVDSWVYTYVKADPSNPSSPHVGELAVSWMNGYSGGHYLTIVGYDDNVWIDVNGNGKVDAGEKGAFLIANSWGTSWGNNGFIWIAYDAFRAVSGVPNGPSSGRVAAGAAMSSMVMSVVPLKPNYSPSLVATFTLSQSVRNQIAVQAGISSTSASNPSSTLTNFALKNQGGGYEFNGTKGTNPQSATFAFDMTDLIPNSSSTMRYYLKVQDNLRGASTQITSFNLVDLIHQQNASCTQVPLSCDNSGVTAFVDYGFLQGNVNDTNPPVVSISSPSEGDTLSGTVGITVNATDDVAVQRVELYLDSQLIATDTTNPYYFSQDTTQWTNGTPMIRLTIRLKVPYL